MIVVDRESKESTDDDGERVASYRICAALGVYCAARRTAGRSFMDLKDVAFDDGGRSGFSCLTDIQTRGERALLIMISR